MSHCCYCGLLASEFNPRTGFSISEDTCKCILTRPLNIVSFGISLTYIERSGNNVDQNALQQLVAYPATLSNRKEDKLSKILAQDNPKLLDDFLTHSHIDFTAADPFFKSKITNKLICEVLLQHNAIPDFDYVAIKKNVLRRACKVNNFELVKFLVSQGADVNPLNKCQLSPLSLAKLAKNKRIIKFLLHCGANNSTMNYTTPTKKEIILFNANLTSPTHLKWTDLARATYNGDITLATEIIETKVCEIDLLTLYCAVVSRNHEIFPLIWSKIDANTVKYASRLMIFVFNSWNKPEHLHKYPILLSREDVNLQLYKFGRLFVWFLDTILDKYGNDVLTEEFYNLVKLFGRRGLRITTPHVQECLIYLIWDDTPRRHDLITICLKSCLPNVTRELLLLSFTAYLSDLFIPYCLHLNCNTIYRFIATCNEPQLPTFLKFCTQTFTISRSKKALLVKLVEKYHSNTNSDCPFQCLPLVQEMHDDVKSLVELSRDVLRCYFSDVSCSTTRDFILTLEVLKIPQVIKNILQYQVPMYELKE